VGLRGGEDEAGVVREEGEREVRTRGSVHALEKGRSHRKNKAQKTRKFTWCATYFYLRGKASHSLKLRQWAWRKILIRSPSQKFRGAVFSFAATPPKFAAEAAKFAATTLRLAATPPRFAARAPKFAAAPV
jgi:hypothetical protein